VRCIALLLSLVAVVLSACNPSVAEPPRQAVIDRRPPAPSWPVRPYQGVPSASPGVLDRSYDMQHLDLREVDLSGKGQLLRDHALFDSDTLWPSQLPAEFQPAKQMELGKDPGLGVRALHKTGVTGKGVHVAILDQTLLVEHQEYEDRVIRYGEIGQVSEWAAKHAPAVASILVGKTVGVAPGADLTYYATQLQDKPAGQGGQRTLQYIAQGITRILDDNKKLAPDKRVRVISISVGPMPQEPGFAEASAATQRALDEGVLVVWTEPEHWYGRGLHGMDRDPLADPNDPRSYTPGSWAKNQFWNQTSWYTRMVLLPMDSRTVASNFGPDKYTFHREGGLSWSAPYLAGVYALALQACTTTAPKAFLEIAHSTGDYVPLKHDGKDYRFGPIINPTKIVNHFKANCPK